MSRYISLTNVSELSKGDCWSFYYKRIGREGVNVSFKTLAAFDHDIERGCSSARRDIYDGGRQRI